MIMEVIFLAFGLTWGVGGLALLVGDLPSGRPSPFHPLHYVAAFGPSLAGCRGELLRVDRRALQRRSGGRGCVCRDDSGQIAFTSIRLNQTSAYSISIAIFPRVSGMNCPGFCGSGC